MPKNKKPLTEAEFDQLRREAVVELRRPQNAVAEAKPISPPDGTLPPPEGDDGPKLWELSPDELRARLDAALWPKDDSNHRWVPKPPMSVSDYIEKGA